MAVLVSVRWGRKIWKETSKTRRKEEKNRRKTEREKLTRPKEL